MIDYTESAVKPSDASPADAVPRLDAAAQEGGAAGSSSPSTGRLARPAAIAEAAGHLEGQVAVSASPEVGPAEQAAPAPETVAAITTTRFTQPSGVSAQVNPIRERRNWRTDRRSNYAAADSDGTGLDLTIGRPQDTPEHPGSDGKADVPVDASQGPARPPEPDDRTPAADHPEPDYLPALSGSPVPPTAEEMLDWLELLIEPGQVTELRILGAKDPYNPKGGPFTVSGFYEADHLGSFVEVALGWTHHAKGVYFTLNPVDPELLAVRRNRCDKYAKETATDRDILRRRWMMVDVDPFRYSETTGQKITASVSATDAEKARARGLAEAIYRFLKERGWPDPVAIDSGNGYQLLYRIDEPADDGGLVKRCLQVLAHRFDDDGAEVDCKVFNPARIAKLPGTLARKGEDSGE